MKKKGFALIGVALALLTLAACGKSSSSKSASSSSAKTSSTKKATTVTYNKKIRIAAESAKADRIWFVVYNTGKTPITQDSRVTEIYTLGNNKMQHDFLYDAEEHPKAGVPLSEFAKLSDAQIQTKVQEILAKNSRKPGLKETFAAEGSFTDNHKATSDVLLGNATESTTFYEHIAKPTTVKGKTYTGYYTFLNEYDDNKTCSLITAVGQDTIAAFDKPHTKGFTALVPKE